MQRDVKHPLSKPPIDDSPRGKSTTLGLEGLKLGDRASSKEPGAKPRPKGSAEEKSKPVTVLKDDDTFSSSDKLVDSIQSPKVIHTLFSQGALTKEQNKRLASITNREERNRCLWSMVLSSYDKNFPVFIKALKESGQADLVKGLTAIAEDTIGKNKRQSTARANTKKAQSQGQVKKEFGQKRIQKPKSGSKLEGQSSETRTVLLTSYNVKIETDIVQPLIICMTTDSKGNLVLLDYNNKSVKIFKSFGELLTSFTKNNLKAPFGVAVLADDNIAVTDKEVDSINVYSRDGKLLRKFGEGLIHSPHGIAVSGKGQIIVTDEGERAGCVHVFNTNETLNYCINLDENGIEFFLTPWHVTTSKLNGDIIVSDTDLHCVKVFTSEGKFKYQYGGQELMTENDISNGDSSTVQSNYGDISGNFLPNGATTSADPGSNDSATETPDPSEDNTSLRDPCGLSTDKKGNIYVADFGRHTVHKLRSNAEFVKLVLTEEDGVKHPQTITSRADNELVVADCTPEIKIFKFCN